jgi:hypothetical protein
LSAYIPHTRSVIAIASLEKNRIAPSGMQRKGIKNGSRRSWQKRGKNKRERG